MHKTQYFSSYLYLHKKIINTIGIVLFLHVEMLPIDFFRKFVGDLPAFFAQFRFHLPAFFTTKHGNENRNSGAWIGSEMNSLWIVRSRTMLGKGHVWLSVRLGLAPRARGTLGTRLRAKLRARLET